MAGIFRSYYRRFRPSHATAALWALENPVLFDAELAWESDTKRMKLGDGVSHYNDLPYFGEGGGAGSTGPQGPMGLAGLFDLPGDDGEPGPPGPAGAAGATGAAGADGAPGVPGAQGPMGPPGMDGSDDVDSLLIPPGADGLGDLAPRKTGAYEITTRGAIVAANDTPNGIAFQTSRDFNTGLKVGGPGASDVVWGLVQVAGVTWAVGRLQSSDLDFRVAEEAGESVRLWVSKGANRIMFGNAKESMLESRGPKSLRTDGDFEAQHYRNIPVNLSPEPDDPENLLVPGQTGPQGPAGADGAPGAQGPMGPSPFPVDPDDPENLFIPGSVGQQGPAGADGAPGAQGPQGPPGATLDPDDPDWIPVPGPQGIPGATGADGAPGAPGAQGLAGPPGFGLEGEDGEWYPVPGSAGPAGADGAAGAQGQSGPPGFGTDGEDGETWMFQVTLEQDAAARGQPDVSDSTFYSLPGVVPMGIPGGAAAGGDANKWAEATHTSGTLFYMPIYVSDTITVDELACLVQTGVAGNVRMGIYAADESWQPTGAPLVDSGSITTNVAGKKTYAITPALELVPGRYLLVSVSDATISLRRLDGYLPDAVAIDSALGTSGAAPHFLMRRTWRTTFAYAALPASPTAWVIAGTTLDAFGFYYTMFIHVASILQGGPGGVKGPPGVPGPQGPGSPPMASDGEDGDWFPVPGPAQTRVVTVGSLIDGAGATITTGTWNIWRVPYPCVVTAVRAYADVGTTTVINAGKAGTGDFCSANVTIDPATAWEEGTVNQNVVLNPGDTVYVKVNTAGTATKVTIQVDVVARLV